MQAKWTSRLTAGVFVGLFVVCLTPVGQAASIDPNQRTGIEQIVRDYLVQHPEVLQEAFEALQRKQAEAQAAAQKQVLSANRDKLLYSPRQMVLGNPQGDITLVEFFDYNCPYCHRALSDTMDLLRTDPNLRMVLKEFPVLGPGSTEAAKVAIALKRQGTDKYLAFHQQMLSGRGQVNEQRALDVAKNVGADMAQLKKDMADPEVQATIAEVYGLANALGISGTPSYVIGDEVVPGAVGSSALKEKITAARVRP
jgi:protein-disulfide isomerase